MTREQDIEEGNHNKHCWIESTVAIELRPPRKQRYKYGKDDSDCVSHGTSLSISLRRIVE